MEDSRWPGRRRRGRPQQSWRNQVVDLEEGMAEDSLGVDERLLAVYHHIIDRLIDRVVNASDC